MSNKITSKNEEKTLFEKISSIFKYFWDSLLSIYNNFKKRLYPNFLNYLFILIILVVLYLLQQIVSSKTQIIFELIGMGFIIGDVILTFLNHISIKDKNITKQIIFLQYLIF